MKKWNQSTVDRYNAESQSFDNFGGGIVQDSYIGENYIGESRADGGASPMGGDIFSKLSDGEKYYTVVVTNTQTSGAAVTAIVFGANQYSGSTQANAGVTVTVQESSHAEVRSESQNSPFWVNGLRYMCATASQLQGQVPTIQRRNSAGVTESVQFRPLSFKTADQQSTTQIDAPNYAFQVDGTVSMQVPVIASEVLTILFQIGGRFNASQSVSGKSPLEVANQRALRTGIVSFPPR